MLPALAWRSEKHGSGQRIISDKVGSLFPMRVGARMTFRADVSTDKPPFGWGFHWICEVQDRQEIAGPVGTIDAFKVGCGRENTDEMVFFYAPEIGHYVTKTSSSTGDDGARVKHLIAYEKMNAEGALERVAFNSRQPARAGPGASEPPAVEPATETVQLQSTAVQTARAPATQASEIEVRARDLLAQRKEVRSPRLAQLPPRTLVTDTLEERTMPAAGVEPSVASPRVPEIRTEYRLVTRTLPDFPPRPKLNPLRKTSEKGDQAEEQQPTKLPPRNVAEVPSLPTAPSDNPFDVSIVKKAYAAPGSDGAAIKKARERAIQSPGLGDEALMAVKSTKVNREKVPSVASGKAANTQIAALPSDQAEKPAATGASNEKFFGLHLGTFLGPRKALHGWRYIYRSHKDLLAGLQPRIRRHDLGAQGVRYRLRVVPFANEASAASLCARLSKRGKFCRVTLE